LSDRCPYCSDYESIKEELKETKRNAEKAVKDSLENCERERRKIKKQLMSIGIVVVVAGTLLGKEFVDKVAEYLESFNSVKDAGSNLISESLSKPPKNSSTPWPSFAAKSSGYAMDNYPVLKTMNIQLYQADLDQALDNTSISNMGFDTPYFFDDSIRPDLPVNPFYTDWSYFMLYEEPESMLPQGTFQFEDPLDIQLYNASPVPGPGVLMCFALGLLFCKRKQR
tara:strand:+ start:597 stop:1271 length:675 start_codon:yes stop_codon:yes gene_type:complete